jgi:hypothetical protein
LELESFLLHPEVLKQLEEHLRVQVLEVEHRFKLELQLILELTEGQEEDGMVVADLPTTHGLVLVDLVM